MRPSDAFPARAGAARRTIWLASFPRSGNTYLRCILNRCFGLPSTSVYGLDDLGGNAALERYAGHFNADSPPPGLDPDAPLLVKTHHAPADDGPAIYVVRDGRAATVSLWEFMNKRMPLRALICGYSAGGTWSSHVAAWRPWARPNTLLLRYEDMVEELPAVLARLSRFLDRPILSPDVPSRDEVAAIDGRWVREASDWRRKVGRRHLQLFESVDGEMLARLGYEPRGAACGAAAQDTGRVLRLTRTADDALAALEVRSAAAYWRLRRGAGRRLALLRQRGRRAAANNPDLPKRPVT